MSFSPILGNPKPQYEDLLGVPYVGMRLFFYVAGTSTKQDTKTDSGGLTTNTNPVVIGADGFPENNVMIYGDDSLVYKVVAAPPGTDDPPTSPLWTIDNILPTSLITDLADTSDVAKGDALIGIKRTDTAAEAHTLHFFNETRKILIGVDFGASLSRTNGTDDWTTVIQAANDAASALVDTSNEDTNIFYATNVVVEFPQGLFEISAQINWSKGVNPVGSGMGGTVIRAATVDTYKAFDWPSSGFRDYISGFTFIGFTTAIEYDTNNTDTSVLNIEKCITLNNTTFLDTVSYALSRSTKVSITDCISHKTDRFVTCYTDFLSINECWVTHSGYDGSAMLINSKCTINGGIFVPSNTGSSTNRRWIDFYAQDGSRNLNILGARFGAEAGSMTIVWCYANGLTAAAGGDARRVGITFRDCELSTAGGGAGLESTIRLYAKPNFIRIQNCGGGFGSGKMIEVDSSISFTRDEVFPQIYIDETSREMGRSATEPVESQLQHLMREKQVAGDQFNKSFRSTIEGRIAAATVDASNVSADIEVYFDSARASYAADDFAFMVTCLGIPDASAVNYSTIVVAIVSVTGGWTGSAQVRRLQFTVQHNGQGSNPFASGTIASVQWQNGSADIGQSSATGDEDTITITWTSVRASDSYMTITPLYGIKDIN